MPLHIKDRETIETIQRLAKMRGATLTDTVRIACHEALEREIRARRVAEGLADIHARVNAATDTGQSADKAFFDAEWSHA